MGLLDNENTQPLRCKTKNWVELNDDRRRTYNKKTLRFKTKSLKQSICDASNVYIAVAGQGANYTTVVAVKNNKKVIFKNWNKR